MPMLHFVGFKGDEYTSARRVFGEPDFIHRKNDSRMRREIHITDTVVYANGSEAKPSEYNASDPDGLDEERRQDALRYNLHKKG